MAKLFLIDDDEGNRMTLSALLELEGHDVSLAASAAEARFSLAAGAAPDIVLLDQHLGDALGSDLVPDVRTLSPGAKVVIISGNRIEHDPLHAAPDATFLKGDGFEELVVLVDRLLAPP